MITEVTILRAIGILLVVFGHADIHGQHVPFFYPAVKKVVYSFHMPLFMFISGFVFMYTKKNKDIFSYAYFIKKKIHRLLIPSFIVLTIAFFLRAMSSHLKSAGAASYSIKNYFNMYFFKAYLPIEFFWFIFTLFNIFLFSRLLLYSIKNIYLILILTSIFIAMNLFPMGAEIFYIKYTCSYIVYFWFGCLSCIAISDGRFIQAFNGEKVLVVLTIVSLILLITLNMIEKRTEVESFVCAISGIFASCSFARWLSHLKLEVLHTVGKYSYQIFLLSWFFHRIVETIGFQKMHLVFWITFPLSFLLASFGPLVIARILEMRIPKSKFALGVQ